jgi:hypothetical protein
MLTLLPLPLTLLPGAAEAGAGGEVLSVLSVMGQATSKSGGPLEAGKKLGAREVIEAGTRGVVQLLIGGRLALTVADGARVELAATPPRVAILRTGLVRLSGAGGTLAHAGWEARTGGGATVLVARDRLFVLRGRVGLVRGAGGAEETLRAGQATVLAAGGPSLAVGAARPDPALLRRSLTYQPPPRWEPGLTRISLDQISQARDRLRQQQRREREAASCGCTESAQSGAGNTARSASGPGLEALNAKLRIRIKGLPRKVK